MPFPLFCVDGSCFIMRARCFRFIALDFLTKIICLGSVMSEIGELLFSMGQALDFPFHGRFWLHDLGSSSGSVPLRPNLESFLSGRWF